MRFSQTKLQKGQIYGRRSLGGRSFYSLGPDAEKFLSLNHLGVCLFTCETAKRIEFLFAMERSINTVLDGGSDPTRIWCGLRQSTLATC